MKNRFRHAAFAAGALVVTGSANAVPVIFEFSGTVTSVSSTVESWVGQRAIGRFEFETDHFSLLPTSPSQPQYTWTDVLPADARPPTMRASFAVAGQSFRLDEAVDIYGGIHFVDLCSPAACGPLENWTLGAYTQSFPLGGPLPTDGYTASTLSFTSRVPLADGARDYFDGPSQTPVDVLALPLEETLGSFFLNEYTCVEGECAGEEGIRAQFAVDTVVRRVGAVTAVPEPGPLGLFAFSLAIAWLVRRGSSRVDTR